MSGIATAIVGSAVVGGYFNNRAASNAQASQERMTDSSNALLDRQYDQTREDAAPWRQAGVTALGQLGTGTAEGGDFNRDFTMADFTSDPGFEFRREQGLRGVEARAASRGLLGSGGTLKDLTTFNSGLASQEFGDSYNRWNTDRTNRFNRLSTLAGLGQTANTQVGNAGAATAGAISNNMTSLGNAQAGASIARGNAFSGAANTLGNFAMGQYYLNQLKPKYDQPTYPQPDPRITGPFIPD